MSHFAVVWDLNGVLFKSGRVDQATLSIVKTLYQKGIDQYICTNTSSSTLNTWLEEDLLKYFNYIFTAREVGYWKPDSRVFKYLKEHITEKDIILVDDLAVNVKAANLVGIHSIRYTSDEQLINEFKLLGIYDDIKREGD